ncbi:MAG TPA: hypothetical protein VIO11_07385 [Candidatus Methanoperedens sp.]
MESGIIPVVILEKKNRRQNNSGTKRIAGRFQGIIPPYMLKEIAKRGDPYRGNWH